LPFDEGMGALLSAVRIAEASEHRKDVECAGIRSPPGVAAIDEDFDGFGSDHQGRLYFYGALEDAFVELHSASVDALLQRLPEYPLLVFNDKY
jgi:hypothetical protein